MLNITSVERNVNQYLREISQIASIKKTKNVAHSDKDVYKEELLFSVGGNAT